MLRNGVNEGFYEVVGEIMLFFVVIFNYLKVIGFLLFDFYEDSGMDIFLGFVFGIF